MVWIQRKVSERLLNPLAALIGHMLLFLQEATNMQMKRETQKPCLYHPSPTPGGQGQVPPPPKLRKHVSVFRDFGNSQLQVRDISPGPSPSSEGRRTM